MFLSVIGSKMNQDKAADQSMSLTNEKIQTHWTTRVTHCDVIIRHCDISLCQMFQRVLSVGSGFLYNSLVTVSHGWGARRSKAQYRC